ncbi:MAG TPA: MFS transporter [Rhabdochlamydiaceae bacterium]|nr:MFS transporter [Rhabdochlamydiaceae bacterium]
MFKHFAGMIGNVLGNYDKALFGLMAPFIAPLFFGPADPVTALILTYAMLPLGFVTKPLGSLFFGRIGDRYGRKIALSCSLVGIAIFTLGIGFLPVYKTVGAWAPVCLALARMLQSLFVAGESTGAALYLLENTAKEKRSLLSGLYGASSLVGYVIASGLVAWFSLQGYIEEGWRILFWIGGLAAIFGVFLRLKKREEDFKPVKRLPLLQVLKQHRSSLLTIIIASGFSFVTYAMPCVLMNGFVPLVTNISKTAVMQVNTLLLIVDMALLPVFGYLAQKFGKERVMFIGSFGSAVLAIPLFYLVGGASLGMVIAIRLILVILGVVFAAPYYAWAIERVIPEHRYTVLCLGSSLGSQLIGGPASAISLSLYQMTGWVWSSGLYLLMIGALASYVVKISARNKELLEGK